MMLLVGMCGRTTADGIASPAADFKTICDHGKREHILLLHLNVAQFAAMFAAECISTLTTEAI